MQSKDITGLRFGKLVAIRIAGRCSTGMVWRLICDCGKTTKTALCNLSVGDTKSCGCLKNGKYNLKHGKSFTSTYHSWASAKGRCTNKNNAAWSDYGGRGIEFSKKWLDFNAFYKDMGDCPKNNCLDRINNNGNYEPGNCRWTTRTEQARNKRSNVILTHNGATKVVQEWANITGIKRETLLARIRAGWNAKDVIETIPEIGRNQFS